MKKSKLDLELLKVIESVKDANMSWCKKCDKVLEFKKSRGLIGIHCSTYPEKDQTYDNEDLAKGLFKMFELEASGKFDELEEGDVL